MSIDDGQQATSGGEATGGTGRVRKNTLERFNDEMSVLDRPLEGDVEYYDEVPPSKWPRVGAIAAALFILGGGGFLALSRFGVAGAHAPELAAAPIVAPAQPPAPVAVAAPAAAPMPVMPAAAIEPEAEPEVDAIPSDVPSVATVVAPSPWTRIAQSSGRAKHARGTSHKASRHPRRGHR